VLLAWGLIAAARGGTALPALRDGGSSDLAMYRAITARVAAGEDYYRVLAAELPVRGYAIRPVFNWRLPTLTWINAAPPSPVWGRVLLVVVGMAAMVLWLLVARRSVARAAIPAALVIMLSIAPVLVVPASAVFYEVWAGLLVAASLACWSLGRSGASVAFGASALMIRELALPFALVMAVLAWRESKRREAMAWIGAVAAFGAYWAWHVSHVLNVMPAAGLSNSWTVAGGWPFVLKASQASILLMLTPERVAPYVHAIAIPLVWAGAWYWRDATGRRLAVTLSAYFALFMLVGRPDNWYWGFVIAPLFPLAALGYFHGPHQPKARRRGPRG